MQQHAMPGGDPVEFLRRTVDQAQRYVNSVSPAEMGNPSPCTEWRVRDVITHMVRGNQWAALVVEHGSAPRPEPVPVGDDAAAEFADASQTMIDAFEAPGALGKPLTLPFGVMPAAGFAMVRAADLLIHTWDVARGTGQTLNELDPDLYAAALQLSEVTMKDMVRPNPAFGAITPIAADAPVWDRFAAFHGRDVGS